MNTFGRIFRISIFGESHGPLLGITLDGVPPGIAVSESDFSDDIARRKPGAKGTTGRVERDIPEIVSGWFGGFTTGAPLTLIFRNSNVRSADYSALADHPRPGHADLVARRKYHGFNDYRGGGHFSGRLTLALVAAGVLAKKIIAPALPRAQLLSVAGQNPDSDLVERALAEGDSVGGIVECRVSDLPLGLGEPFFDSVESLISHLAFAIPGVKGVEFGAGFASAQMRGSQHNDAILDSAGHTKTNNAGGANGGITNGNELVFRVAVKPTSSIAVAQHTYNFKTDSAQSLTVGGRHDACIALRMPVILEAVAAIVLADFLLIDSACGNTSKGR